MFAGIALCGENEDRDFSPKPDEEQLPFAMHSKMEQLPHIMVGQKEGDLVGRDNRVLQAAVDYIAALGGGTVEIGPGEYLMRDSLHLRSSVTVTGSQERTILRKAAGVVSLLALDGDFGEQQVTVRDPSGFEVGSGIAVWDNTATGFHISVARITGRTGNTFSIDKPLMSDCLVSSNAKAGTLFPVISGYDIQNARVQNLAIEGNKSQNATLNGCRGGGIFLYHAFGTVVQNCTVRNYNGDGISFQQSNDVSVLGCTVEGNAYLGIHPGSGSQRPRVQNCVARENGTDGLYLCWRVRHGLFEDNILERNGRFGISIGHKDSDNLLQGNQVRLNQSNGIFFRNESLAMAPHRNRLINNVIENNGAKSGTAGIRIRGVTNDLLLKENTIRDTRTGRAQTQTVGVFIDKQVGPVSFEKNRVQANKELDDRRTESLK